MTMPRTKKKPGSPPANGPLAPPAEVLTLADAAAYLRVTPEDVLRLMREQALPGRRVGADWRFLKAALQDWLRTGPANKGLLERAGAMKDDPHAEEMLRETYKARGRPERGATSFWQTHFGALKDDPHLEAMLKEIYKQRGRPEAEST